MKKIVTSFVLLLVGSGFLYAQQSVQLHMGFKPETKYNQWFKQNGKTKVSYGGSEEVMEALKERGQDSVMEVLMESEMETIVKTGKSDKSGRFPVTCEFTSVKNNMPNASVKTGTKLFGKATLSAAPVYDSAYAPGIEKEEADKLITMMSGMLSQIKIPDTIMKPGDVFVIKTPIAVPVGPVSLDMEIETTYKLVSIEKGIGYFDVDQVYGMSIKSEEMNLPLKGAAKGKMEYDIANNFLRLYKTDLEMTMVTNMQGVDMSMLTSMQMEMIVKLGK